MIEAAPSPLDLEKKRPRTRRAGMLHCSHEHDRTNATGALQLCDKQPICDVVACDTTSREKIISTECGKQTRRFYAIV
jgi:hypothetical protein